MTNKNVTEGIMEDERCCGSGTCIINTEGHCWCGQRWNGSRMCFPEVVTGIPAGDQAAESSGLHTARSDLPAD